MKYNIVFIGMLMLVLVPNVYGMPYDYSTPDPIETLDVFVPSTAQSWRELTVAVYVCDGRFNPDCEYGHNRTMLETSIVIDIYKIDDETGEPSIIESLVTSTDRWGSTTKAFLLDDNYEPRHQYLVTVSTDDRVSENTFWLFQKTY